MLKCPRVALVGLILAFHTTALAQVPLPSGVAADAYGQYHSCHNPGRAWNNPTSAWLEGEIGKQHMQGLLFNNMVSTALFNEMVLTEVRRSAGQERIDSGRASCAFQPSPAASSLGRWIDPQASPVDQAAQRASLEQNLLDFAAALERHGCRQANLVDAVALGFVVNYTALHDQDPGPQRLAHWKRELETAWLKDPLWMGYSDAERQAQYESIAIQSMLAISARAQTRRPGLTEPQRQRLLSAASTNASAFFQRYWSLPVEGLELTSTGFGDRGQRLVAEGGGQADFVRSEPSSTVAEYAQRWAFLWPDQGQAPFAALLREFDQRVTLAGASDTNCADANALAFALCHELVHPDLPPLNPAQIRWLRGEMQADLEGSADFLRLGDAGRQRIYDGLALDVMLARSRLQSAEAELAQPLPNEAFERMAALMIQGYARERRETALAECRRLMEAIFSPRKLGDFELRAEGYAPRGAAAVVHRPLPGARRASKSTAPETPPAPAGS